MARITTPGRPLVRFCGLDPTIRYYNRHLVCPRKPGRSAAVACEVVFIIIRSWCGRRSLPRLAILYWHKKRCLVLARAYVVAAMMMLMMIMRLRSGPFSIGLGRALARQWGRRTLGVFSIQGTCARVSFWMEMRWILLGSDRPDPEPNLARAGRLDGPSSVSPRA